MKDLQDIIFKTSRVVPTAWDMHHEKFNCACHLEITDMTITEVVKAFNIPHVEAREMIDNFLKR